MAQWETGADWQRAWPKNWVGIPTDKARSMAMLGPWGGSVDPGWLRKQDMMDQLLGGFGGMTGSSSSGGPGGSGGTEDLLNSMLADIQAREDQSGRTLTNRFGALGRSTTSTAYSQASEDLAGAFTRERTAARAKAQLVNQQQQQANQQNQLNIMQMILSALK